MMTDLAEEVRKALAKLRNPVSNAPEIFLECDVVIEKMGENILHIILYARDPYSPKLLIYAEAAKRIASKTPGVAKVYVEVRNHFMAEQINLMLNG